MANSDPDVDGGLSNVRVDWFGASSSELNVSDGFEATIKDDSIVYRSTTSIYGNFLLDESEYISLNGSKRRENHINVCISDDSNIKEIWELWGFINFKSHIKSDFEKDMLSNIFGVDESVDPLRKIDQLRLAEIKVNLPTALLFYDEKSGFNLECRISAEALDKLINQIDRCRKPNMHLFCKWAFGTGGTRHWELYRRPSTRGDGWECFFGYAMHCNVREAL